MGNRRMGTIARGLLVVAALALLPLAGLGPGQGPRPVAAQTTSQDSLWAAVIRMTDSTNTTYPSYYGACANPSSSAALAGCFSSLTSIGSFELVAMATDGVNVYYATYQNGGYSCPIAALGANCVRIMAGPWGSGSGGVYSLAAYDGQIWIGQKNGQIYRCPANIPDASQSSAPADCVLLDQAGLAVQSLLLANGTLYAGLAGTKKSQGILWS
ncbi:MAG: hypothetical protein ACKOWF_09270, partial [Chloroflexota bacterium]